ncbi:MAG: glycine C-acetyltransferase [SAR202 cluster bacterium]|nr:glycine C-acetyltransferase [SAR202 cluster bacterium]
MSYTKLGPWLEEELQGIHDAGLFKQEKIINGPQGSHVDTRDGAFTNFCANNYLGLADHPEIIKAVEEGLKSHGFGMASVRFICGTQDIHKALEDRITRFLGTEDTILYTSCFDANTGLFETILGKEDALISDALNHASIIDGVRLCRAQRKVYAHADMADLEEKLKEVQDARFRLIATDGVFSMQGTLAPLREICDLAGRYDALVMVDDSHATGFMGPNGRGTPEELGVADRVDIVTSTLGKALGGASGGFTSGRKAMVEYLRQRSRTYLFSNAVAPPVVAGALKALEMAQERPELRKTLWDNTAYFRGRMSDLGFDIIKGIHPIVPIMLRDELKTVEMAKAVNKRGVFVVGFTYPVVPRGEARVRVQVSAAHTREQLDTALNVFEEVGKGLGLI